MQCNKSFGLTVIHRRTNWIELYIYTIATDTNGMLPALIRTLMIATVLACPALGGRCCDAGHSDVAAGTLTVNGCETCCCHDSDLPSPACPAEGGECHDCFCAGRCRSGRVLWTRFRSIRSRSISLSTRRLRRWPLCIGRLLGSMSVNGRRRRASVWPLSARC